jgi:hypothetical protein
VSGVDLAAIVAFVNARLDEDEREATWAAEEAGGAAWTIRSTDVVLADDTDRYVSGNAQNEVRDHIARYDPARVLTDVAAKRRLLDLHEPIPSCSAGILQCRHCADLCHSGSGLSCDSPDAPYPCPTVRLLAASFAAHPDFDPAWAVT